MTKENKALLLSLLQEWFKDTDAQYKDSTQDKRWCLDTVGIYLKKRLTYMDHWKNARRGKQKKINPFL